MDKLKLRFSKEVVLGEFKIKIPTIKQIIELGDEKFDSYIKPYVLSKELLQADEDVLAQLCDFDLFFLHDGEGNLLFVHENISYLELLLKSLEFYFQEKAHYLTAKDLKETDLNMDLDLSNEVLESINLIFIENNGFINRDNYNGIADMILKINNVEKKKPEPIPEFENDRQRDVYNKIMEGRRRKSEKEAVTVADMIDIVQFGGRSFVDYSVVEKFTIPQIVHAYATILSINDFEINFGQYQAGVDPKELDLDHWAIRINKANKQDDKHQD